MSTRHHAPPTTEAAGPVDPSSLAAESVRSHGAFASNRGASPRTVPDATSMASAHSKPSSDHPTGSGEPQGQTAPSYITTSEDRGVHAGIGGEGGAASATANPASRTTQPKGENVEEGFEEKGKGGNRKLRDGTRAAFAAEEAGGKDDPSRVAEEKFRRGNEMGGKDGGGSGVVEGEGGMFEALKSEEAA